jgi:hypothetical protein
MFDKKVEGLNWWTNMCGRAADRLMLLENDIMKMASAARVQKEPTCLHVWTQRGPPVLAGRRVMAWPSIGDRIDRINDGRAKWGKTDVIGGVYILVSFRAGTRVTEPFVLSDCRSQTAIMFFRSDRVYALVREVS